MNNIKNKQHGFTIVELLIVIVVIAILAAISVVAYNGIQERANNTSRISNANSAVKVMTSYMAAENKYPTLGNSCIGDGFAQNNTRCWGVDSPTPASRDSAFNNELSKISSLPKNTTPEVPTTNYSALGPVFSYSSGRVINGQSNPALVIYFLDGQNKDCGLPNIVRQTGTNEFTTYNGSPSNSVNQSNATMCYVALPTL